MYVLREEKWLVEKHLWKKNAQSWSEDLGNPTVTHNQRSLLLFLCSLGLQAPQLW